MAITVKKKSLKLKSDAPDDAASDATVEPEAPQSVLASMSSGRTEAPVKSGGSFVPFFIAALLACILMGTLIAIQLIENGFYTGIVR